MSLSSETSFKNLPGPSDWVRLAKESIKDCKKAILIFVCFNAGSTPRETGTWILVSKEGCIGTIGGGEVERIAIESARSFLLKNTLN